MNAKSITFTILQHSFARNKSTDGSRPGVSRKGKRKEVCLPRTITIYYFRFWGENEETKGVARCAFSVVFFFPPYLNPTKTPNVQLIVPLSSFKKYSSVPFSCL